MNLEGRLGIELEADGGVRIRSNRPLGVVALFAGKTPDQLLQLIPLLFPLCGTAQSYCALQACRQTLGEAAEPATLAAQRRLVDLETVKEHALRVLMGWAEWLEEPADAISARILAGSLPRCRSAWFGAGPAFALSSRAAPDAAADPIAPLEEALSASLFGAAPADWLATVSGRAELQDWAERGTTVAARLLRSVLERDWQAAGGDGLPHLPPLDDPDIAGRLERSDAGEFCARPDWQGRPCETTCLSRRRDVPLIAELERSWGKSLLTRLSARLVELATLAVQLKRAPPDPEAAPQPPPQRMGIGQVEAARGRLIHGLLLEQGRIARYHIAAPTEWNFHPQGPAAKGLAGLAPGAQRRRQAELLIGAIDPCVAYDLRIGE